MGVYLAPIGTRPLPKPQVSPSLKSQIDDVQLGVVLLDAVEQWNHFRQPADHVAAVNENRDRGLSQSKQHRAATFADVELGDELSKPSMFDELGGQPSRERRTLRAMQATSYLIV